MEKGDIWLADLDEGAGHEQKGRRPVLVMGVENGMAVCVPITSNCDMAAFACTEVIEPCKENGLTETSVALVYQMKALDKKKRMVQKMGRLSKESIQAIDDLVINLLRLNPKG